MNKISIILILSILFLYNNTAVAQENGSKILTVPFTSEIPNGSWTGPWKNACEEASIVMVKGYYFGYKSTTKKIAAADMEPIFKIENKIFGSNADTDATRTAKLINDFTDVVAKIKTDPTIEEIKNELDQNRPVIALLNMKNILKPNHHFRAGGSYYHVLVITGYDDNTSDFITNDNGDEKTGEKMHYSYDEIMNNLHDFNHKTKKANGPATVIFTDSKVLFKEKNDPKVYLIKHDTKHHITDSHTFKKNGFKWEKIRVVEKNRLDKLKTGEPLSS